MITSLRISNLKSFEDSGDLRFSRVNLLTGLNGRGKSTVIQTLLLIAQSYDTEKGIGRISLKGKFIDLGTYDDVLRRGAEPGEIGIDITTDDEADSKICFILARDENDQKYAVISDLLVDEKSRMESVSSQGFVVADSGAQVVSDKDIPVVADNVEKVLGSTSDVLGLRQLRNVCFISADREGGVNIKKNDTEWNPRLGVGIHGQYVMNMLEVATPEQKQEINQWYREILDGGYVKTHEDKERHEIAMYIDPAGTEQGFKPSNVGFGYSYILTILVAIVMADEGSKMFIENPEAHLHPSAQANLIAAIVEIAKKKNLQVFIESHSDHVVHGLQLSVKKNIIDHSELSVLFFSFDEDIPNLSQVCQMGITEDGHIENPPSGFFDQAEQDLSTLIGLDDIDNLFEE
jgi:predicted ATPase